MSIGEYREDDILDPKERMPLVKKIACLQAELAQVKQAGQFVN